MCIQVVERYAACGCLYYKHQVDACSNYRRRGHDVQSREVLVGYSCATHSPLHRVLRDSLIFAFANLLHSTGSTAATQSSDPCRDTNSYTITDTIELDTLQSEANTEASNRRTPQLPTTISDNVNEAEYPSIGTCDTGKTKRRPSIPPCYLLIFLGLLTVIGSLLPGVLRASLDNDLSGGFTLAQYILGVGIFVVGSMVAIHSKTCECWKSPNRVGQVVVDGH